jgi:Kef-type K+ transport system membrane component KefB
MGCAPPVTGEARLIAAHLDDWDRDGRVITDTGDFLAVLLAAALAPILAALATRAWSALVVPVVVAELLLGIVIGPDVLALASPTDLLEFLGQLGLGFLFFFAGYEIRFDRVRGTPLRLAAIGWLCSLALAYSLAGLLEAGGIVISGLLTGSAMATTALGTLIPLLRDTHQLDTPSGSHVLAVGAVGEFGPVLIVTLLLGATSDTATEALLLVAFVVVAVLAATIATGAVGRSWDFLERSLKTSGQLPVRLTVLSVFALVVLAADLGLDVILGAFAAGLLVQTVLQGKELERFESKLDAVGFGLLIPFFFVTSGIAFDLDSLTSSAGALLKLPLFLGLFLVVRGMPVLLLYRRELPGADRTALALFASTQLPLVVAITTIGVEQGHMRSSTAAALVGAAVLSVLIFPSLALARRARAIKPAAAGPRPPRSDSAAPA